VQSERQVCPQPVAQVVVAISEETRDRVKASATSLRDVVAGVVSAFTPIPGRRRTRLREDITELTDAVYTAFRASITASD
jgi:hypothetical protein